MTVDVALALIKDDPRVVDGNPCYPDPMPDIGEAGLIYGYFVDRRAEVKTGFAEVNGAKLYYETAGEGDPVIMIHGWGGDLSDWEYLFTPLAEQYQVVRYDLRGFGQSDRPTTEPYSHVEDLKALMESLGIEKAHLIGQSYGGEVALDFAIAHPESTLSLIGSSPGIGGTEEMAYTAEEQAAVDQFNAALEAALAEEDWQAAAEALLLLPEFTTAAKHPTAGARLVEMVKDFEWWQMFREDPLVAPETPAVEQLDKVTAPTLVIAGELGASTDLARADLLEQGMSLVRRRSSCRASITSGSWKIRLRSRRRCSSSWRRSIKSLAGNADLQTGFLGETRFVRCLLQSQWQPEAIPCSSCHCDCNRLTPSV